MSEAGMSFVSEHPCVPGDELTMAFRVDAVQPPFQVLCVVRHAGQSTAGVEFLNLHLAERLRLTSFLTRHGSRPVD